MTKCFLNLIQNEIQPLTPVPTLEIPQDHIGIALHVRRGGGYDYGLAQTDTLISAQFIQEDSR